MAYALQVKRGEGVPFGMRRRMGDLELYEALFIIGLLLLPYDALHVLPSTYRPIAIVPLALSLLLCAVDNGFRSIRKNQMLLLLFFGYVVVSSAAITLAIKGDSSSFLDVVISLGMGVVLFFSFSSVLRVKYDTLDLKGMLDWLFIWLSRAYTVPILVGLLEALSLIGLLPSFVNSGLVSFFGGNQSSRLTLTSYEASWASYHLLLAAISYCYVYQLRRGAFSAIAFVLSSLLFLYTQSMQGFLILAVAAVLYVVWYSKQKGNLLTLLKWVLTIAAVALVVFLVLTFIYSSQDASSYYARRLLGFVDVEHLVRTDGSSFVRLVFPVIGMQMFIDNPLFGVGGGSFASALPQYILDYYPWSLTFGEIQKDIAGILVPSAVSVYTRVFAEGGFLGALFFYGFLSSVLKGLGALGKGEGRLFIAAFAAIAMICTVLQFASYAFAPFWLAMGLLDSVVPSAFARGSFHSKCVPKAAEMGSPSTLIN